MPLQRGLSCRYQKETIWSARFGDEKSEIMVIAEAPSNKEGAGLYKGGLFLNVGQNPKSPLYKVRDFVRHNFQTIPYCTNIVKCGVENQSHKEKFELRMEACVKHILLKEITSLNPKKIFCLGRTAFDRVETLQKKNLIDKMISIRFLTHYANRAGLPLKIEDKYNWIWACQTGLKDAKNVTLSELYCSKKWPVTRKL